MPETRYEIIDGRVAYVSPAKEPHGSRHSKAAALLEAHVKGTYDVAADMLTRTSAETDFAPDISVFLHARDPQTGGRRIEELAFEILDTQKLGAAATKARLLAARGVRRLFAIDVKKKRALEWSRPTNTWKMLPGNGVIEDPAFVVPLSIQALVVAGKADDAVAGALLAKGNAVLVQEGERLRAEGKVEGKIEGKSEGRIEGKAEGKAEALLAFLKARGLRIAKTDETTILDTRDVRVLDRWLGLAASCTSVKSLFTSPPPAAAAVRRRQRPRRTR
jgi:Uma2 family endonuclease